MNYFNNPGRLKHIRYFRVGDELEFVVSKKRLPIKIAKGIIQKAYPGSEVVFLTHKEANKFYKK